MCKQGEQYQAEYTALRSASVHDEGAGILLAKANRLGSSSEEVCYPVAQRRREVKVV